VASPAEIRAVLFDAAGTLIEPREPVGETYARMARPYGVTLPARRVDDAFRRVLGQAPPLVFPDATVAETARSERNWWRAVVRSTFLAADAEARFSDFDAFFDALYRTFSEPDAWSCRTGCREALTELRARGISTGVVSNFDLRLHGLLEGLELAPLLDAVVLPSDAGAEKPDPRIFRLALERLGKPAAASVFVGDSAERDLAGARAVGMRAVDVGSLATLHELPDHLGRLAMTDRGPSDE
jgi:putative hydrolase of the HAD superfamily